MPRTEDDVPWWIWGAMGLIGGAALVWALSERERTPCAPCPACGHSVQDGVARCPSCGVRLIWEDARKAG